ncbi:MAG: hypothetical protein NTV51_12650 [Verrucomicrobia bacterium]|nr:hypothetical protein [Verrucomicrobiota bacterium]
MKTEIKMIRATALLAGAFFLLNASPALRAAEKAGHEHMEMAKPGTSAAALEAIHKLHATLTTQVTGKQLKAVHDTCEQLTTAANALPGLSKDLPADKLKRVEGAAKNLAKALDALHDAADEGKQADTEKQLKAVDSLLKIISDQYPMAKM